MQPSLTIDFIGIGAEKAGTTWIAEQLKQHPEICLSIPKEVLYFNKTNSLFERRVLGTTTNPRFHKGVNWYYNYFAHCKQHHIKGEICPAYLYDHAAPKKIKTQFPHIKIVVSLRNPVDRAFSQWQWNMFYFGIEKRNFLDAVHNDPDEYISKGLYYHHLRKFYRAFDRQNIMITTLDEIKNRPQQTIGRLYKFLGVKKVSFTPETLANITNPARRSRNICLFKAGNACAYYLSLLGLYATVARSMNRHSPLLAQTATTINNNVIDDDTRTMLMEKFREDILNLQRLTGISCAHWLK